MLANAPPLTVLRDLYEYPTCGYSNTDIK